MDPAVAANMRDRFPSPYTRGDGEAWLALATKALSESCFAIEVAGDRQRCR